MVLACEQCGSSFGPDDIDLTLGVAHCTGCGTVSELRTRTRPQDRPAVPRPASSRWQQDPDGLYLEQNWRGLSLIFLGFFTAFWNGSLVFMISTVAIQEGLVAALSMLVIPHVWVGVVLGYYVVASLVNTTVIEQKGQRLLVHHGPLPWWGNRDLAVSDIDQLYVERSSVRVNKQPRWNLCVMNPQGVGQTLVGLLTTEAEGHWLEDLIEKHLAIEDRPVAGETRTS